MMKHGELTTYETVCKTGYKMKEGEVYQSGHGKSHWAEMNQVIIPLCMWLTWLKTIHSRSKASIR